MSATVVSLVQIEQFLGNLVGSISAAWCCDCPHEMATVAAVFLPYKTHQLLLPVVFSLYVVYNWCAVLTLSESFSNLCLCFQTHAFLSVSKFSLCQSSSSET